MKNELKPYLTEEQRFNQWWLHLTMVGAWVVSVIPINVSLFKHMSQGKADTSLLIVSILTTILVSGTVWFVYSFKLRTKIDSKGVQIQFFPLMCKWIYFTKEQIDKYEVTEYHPVREFGGWGIKRNWKRKSQAYSISGNIGIRLYLKNGKEVLIGTKKKQSAEYALRKMTQNKQ